MTHLECWRKEVFDLCGVHVNADRRLTAEVDVEHVEQDTKHGRAETHAETSETSEDTKGHTYSRGQRQSEHTTLHK